MPLKNEKDPDLSRFESGTRRFERPRTTLADAFTAFGKKVRGKKYERTQAQLDASKRLSDRMMGERDVND